MEEFWKTIEGYPNYMISNLGRVKSLNYHNTGKEKIRKLSINHKGYYQIDLWKNGKYEAFRIHRLVAEAFIPNPNNLPCVNHKDENKQNNFVYINEDGTVDLEKSNIEWCDISYNNTYNNRHKKIGDKLRGKNNTDKSKTVYQYDLNGKLLNVYTSIAEIGRQLNISTSRICACCNNKQKQYKDYIWSYEPK